MLKSSKIFFIVTLLVALGLLAGLTFIVYSIRSQNRKASELINTADRISAVSELTQYVKTIRIEAAADIEALENSALSSNKLIFLIENIEDVGATLELETGISSVERVEEKNSTEPPVFRMILATKGSWLSTFIFLRALESLPYRVVMNEISLSRAEVGWQSRIILSIHTLD